MDVYEIPNIRFLSAVAKETLQFGGPVGGVCGISHVESSALAILSIQTASKPPQVGAQVTGPATSTAATKGIRLSAAPTHLASVGESGTFSTESGTGTAAILVGPSVVRVMVRVIGTLPDATAMATKFS